VPEISDEILMSFADGMLGAEEHARVAALVRASPELARRVRAFECTGVALSKLYDPIAKEPVPHYLLDVINKVAPAAAPKSSPGLLAQVTDFVRSALDAAGLNHQGFAYAAAGAAALAVGWAGYMQLSDPNFMGQGAKERAVIAHSKGRRVAIGDLARLLESKPSLFPSRFSEVDGAAVALLSFKSKDGSFCRQYEMQLSGRKPYSGVACRNVNGRWVLDKQVVVARARNLENVGLPGKTVVAGQPENEAQGDDGETALSVEARIDELISGPALGSVDEGRLIKNQWLGE
jgi:anti-sigma factor RsiW